MHHEPERPCPHRMQADQAGPSSTHRPPADAPQPLPIHSHGYFGYLGAALMSHLQSRYVDALREKNQEALKTADAGSKASLERGWQQVARECLKLEVEFANDAAKRHRVCKTDAKLVGACLHACMLACML